MSTLNTEEHFDILSNPDAEKWASVFMKQYQQKDFEINKETMQQWFAEFLKTSHNFFMHPGTLVR